MFRQYVAPPCFAKEAAQQLLKRANVANAKRTQIASGGMSAIREVGSDGFPWRLVVDFRLFMGIQWELTLYGTF